MSKHRLARGLPFYVKYPFAMSLKDFMKRFYGSAAGIADIIRCYRPEYVERALIRVKAMLSGLEYTPSTFEELEIASFYIGLLLASLLGRWHLRRYVDSEVKYTYAYLVGDSHENLLKLTTKLGVHVEYLGGRDLCGEPLVVGYRGSTSSLVIHCLQYRLPLTEYLAVASKLFSEVRWKLVNQYVRDGYVYLDKRSIARLLEEHLRFVLFASVPEIGSANVVGWVSDALTKLRRELPDKDEVQATTRPVDVGIIDESAFPPCIKDILNKLRGNEHLSHSQRFTLATFLINIGADVEYVLDLFRNTPDFNERIARYQVEHIAGLRGSKRKYLSYGCDKMRSLGMCVAECNVKNPLSYYSKVLRLKTAPSHKR